MPTKMLDVSTLRLVVLTLFLAVPVGASMAQDDLFDELDAEIGATSGESSKGTDDFFDELDMGLDSNEDDLFGELDEPTIDVIPEADSFEVVWKLGKNLSGKIRERYSHFWVKPRGRPNIDKNPDIFNTKFDFETWTGEGFWRLDFTGWAEDGNAVERYSGSTQWLHDGDRYSRHFEANELYFTLSHDDFDVRLGKKVFNNGLSTLFSPADRMKPPDVNDPTDPRILGIWQAVVDYYWHDFTFTGAFFPVYQPIKNPSSFSRWLGSDGGLNSTDFQFSNESELSAEGVTVSTENPEIEPRNFSYFLRAKTVWEGYDLFLSAYYGMNPYWVLRKDNDDYSKEIVQVGNFATGVSTTWKAWEFHGEVLYNHSFDGKDDSYFNYVVGATYTLDDFAKRVFLEQINITLEYAGEWVRDEQSADGYIQSSRNTRIGLSDIFTRINFKYDEDLKFVYLNNFEFEYVGHYNKFEVNYRLREGLTSKVGVEFFEGSTKGGYYGRFRRNHRGLVELEYSF